jgi:defect-in-organelle-trafficking protein DotD
MEAGMAHLTLQLGSAVRPLLATVAVALLAAACSPVIPVPTTVATAGMPNPEQALLQSMQHVDAEMTTLGGMRGPVGAAPAASVSPDELERTVNFTWSGPLDAGAAKLAQSVGYTFFTTLPPGAAGVEVAIDVRGVSALDAFRSLGQGAGTRATVEVDPIHHAVRIIHHA